MPAISPVPAEDPDGRPIPSDRRFNFQPLSPDSRPRRSLSRGRALVRPSVRERWITSRSRTAPTPPRLRAVPEDVAVNVSRSQQDLPHHRSNDDVFEVPSTCSLAWDSQYDVLHASTPTQPCNPTTSTQFDISIAPLHNLTVQEEHADSDEYHSPEDTDMASNHSQAQATPGPATTLQDHMVTL